MNDIEIKIIEDSNQEIIDVKQIHDRTIQQNTNSEVKIVKDDIFCFTIIINQY